MIIWKWQITKAGITEIEVPKGTKFLDTQIQHGKIVVWGICNPELPTERRIVSVYDTGAHVNNLSSEYLGTVQLLEGDLIKHVFIK